MADQQKATPPPTSGPGSGADAWRKHAAKVTDSSVESWAELSRDEVMEQLRADGFLEPAAPADDDQADRDQTPVPNANGRPLAKPFPEWMVPTPNGPVPESQTRR